MQWAGKCSHERTHHVQAAAFSPKMRGKCRATFRSQVPSAKTCSSRPKHFHNLKFTIGPILTTTFPDTTEHACLFGGILVNNSPVLAIGSVTLTCHNTTNRIWTQPERWVCGVRGIPPRKQWCRSAAHAHGRVKSASRDRLTYRDFAGFGGDAA